jgi:uncharacterized protein
MIVDVPERHRYEISVDGEPAGFVRYRLEPERIVFLHTEIKDAFAGRGIGGELARGVLDDARRRGLAVVPLCPFVRGWIDKHPDYADLLAS